MTKSDDRMGGRIHRTAAALIFAARWYTTGHPLSPLRP